MSEHNFNIVNFSIQPESELATFVSKKQFLGDEYISQLVNASIKLGFNLDIIQKTFRIFLKGYKDPVNMFNPNYRQIIDKDKFINALISNASQLDSKNNNNGSNRTSNNRANFNSEPDRLDFDDDYGEENDDSSTNGYFADEQTTSEQVKFSHFDPFANSKQYSSLSINPPNNKLEMKNFPSSLASPSSAVGGLAPITKKPLSAQQLQHQQHSEYQAQQMNKLNDKNNLRPIIIDSNDVASFNSKQIFMFIRVKKVVEYFEKRKHQIYVILSSFRKDQIMNTGSIQAETNRSTSPTPDQIALLELEKNGQIHYTPAKKVGTKRIVCDDDTTILKLAISKSGIIVSNDNFKRFINIEEFKQVIEERVLMYSFIDETFLPAEDPLGKNGPSLDNFLRFESQINQQYLKRCPYKKKCTYGTKCKFWHPERQAMPGINQYKTAHQSVLDEAQENQIKLQIIMSANDDTTSNSTKSPFFSIASSNSEVVLKPQNKNMSLFSNLVQNEDTGASNGNMFNLYGMGKSGNSRQQSTNWTNSFGFDNLTLNDSKSFLVSNDSDSFKSLKKNDISLNISDKQNSTMFMPLSQSKQSTLLESPREENNIRARLLELVKSKDLTLQQVDKVLDEHPNETSLESLIFYASLDGDQFDL